MLSTGIKNAILFLLIILILHFFITKKKSFESFENQKMLDYVYESKMCNQNLKDNSNISSIKKVKADCHLTQDKKDIMIIKEYEDDTNEFNAYDSFDTYYQAYTSSQCLKQ